MTLNVREIFNKLVGAGLLAASVGFFTESAPAAFVPAILLGVSGFWLVIRRGPQAARELELERRVDELAEGLTAMQADLVAALQRVDRLTSAGDFGRQLAAAPAAAQASPAADLPAPANGG